LQRLGVDALDIVFVHDLSPDNPYLPSHWEEQFEIARKGAFSALTRMREEGIIKGWGLGVNMPEPIMKLLDVADPDVCLLASQYSLIDHKNALHHVFPAARAKGVSFVVGSSLNAGFISGSQRYNYGKENYKIPQPIIEKREKLREVAGRHASIFGRRRCNSRQRRISPRPWLSAPPVSNRSSLTTAPCRSRSRRISGRS